MNQDKKSFTLSRQEILRKKLFIQELFNNGSSFYLYPFRVHSTPHAGLGNNQSLFSVSKRKIKKAVHRNVIKRRMREAFRLNKHLLYDSLGDNYSLFAYIYTADKVLSYQEIERGMINVLKKLVDNKN